MASSQSQESTANHAPDPSIISEPKIVDEPWTVSKALDNIASIKPVENSTSPIPYFHVLERLKIVKREGWRRFGIQRGESIADHSYRMAMMTLLAPAGLRARLDLAKCTQMALVHDLAESLVGDLIPSDGVSRAEKNRRETATVEFLAARLLGGVDGGDRAGAGAAGAALREVFAEHEAGVTLEARFVSDVDKVELLLQMVEYEKRAGGRLDLGDFTYVATKVDLPETKEWAAEILREREAFWAGLGVRPGNGGNAENKSHSDRYYAKS